MNWFKKIKIATPGQWFSEEEIEAKLDSIINKELDNDQSRDAFYRKIELEENLINTLSTFPPGFLFRQEINGWSVATSEGKIIVYNEPNIEHAIKEVIERFKFMGLLV